MYKWRGIQAAYERFQVGLRVGTVRVGYAVRKIMLIGLNGRFPEPVYNHLFSTGARVVTQSCIRGLEIMIVFCYYCIVYIGHAVCQLVCQEHLTKALQIDLQVSKNVLADI